MKKGLLNSLLYELGFFVLVMVFFYGLMQVYGNPFTGASDYLGYILAFIVFVIAHFLWKLIAAALGLNEWGHK